MSPKSERLLPPLMHIFRDAHESRDAKKKIDIRADDGSRVLSGRRGMTRQPISEPALRREVMRNLVSLLNTSNLGSIEDLDETPHAARSIINYGIPDIARISIDENRVNLVIDYLREAIINYEPRIVPSTIITRRDKSVSDAELRVRFTISGQLRCEPLDIPVEFVAEVEGDTGKFRIERL